MTMNSLASRARDMWRRFCAWMDEEPAWMARPHIPTPIAPSGIPTCRNCNGRKMRPIGLGYAGYVCDGCRAQHGADV